MTFVSNIFKTSSKFIVSILHIYFKFRQKVSFKTVLLSVVSLCRLISDYYAILLISIFSSIDVRIFILKALAVVGFERFCSISFTPVVW